MGPFGAALLLLLADPAHPGAPTNSEPAILCSASFYPENCLCTCNSLAPAQTKIRRPLTPLTTTTQQEWQCNRQPAALQLAPFFLPRMMSEWQLRPPGALLKTKSRV
ncbi:hypothetical protein DFJ73DRAFT_849412 [Zopfochytrium polystomum]|nr:hypothetical protein DFJ73DRAFT_849412 [Zopfochytrium polystomum]